MATALGADGTPAFVLGLRDPVTNEVRIIRAFTGAQPYDAFAKAIDALLQQQ